MKIRIIKTCLLFFTPIVILFILLGNPLQNYSFLTVNTEFSHTGATYHYIRSNNEEIFGDINQNYVINQDELQKGNISQTLISAIFGSPKGWYQVCFHNINSTFYLYDYDTKIPEPIIFEFNNEEISVLPQQTFCNVVSSDQKFFFQFNNKFFPSPDVEIALNFIQNDKNFVEHLKNQNISKKSIAIQNFVPYYYAESYVSIHWLTYLVGYIVLFFVVAGIVFTIKETKEFLSN